NINFILTSTFFIFTFYIVPKYFININIFSFINIPLCFMPFSPPPNVLLQRQLLPPHEPPSVHHPCPPPPNVLLQRQLLPPHELPSVHHPCHPSPPHYGRHHSSPPYLKFLDTAKELGLVVVHLILFQPTLGHHPHREPHTP
ncbi:hypothetical protein V8G54_031096, partial [Vigna mungo]